MFDVTTEKARFIISIKQGMIPQTQRKYCMRETRLEKAQ